MRARFAPIAIWFLTSVSTVSAMTAPTAAADAPTVRLHAAGSLRTAMAEIAQAFTAAYSIKVDGVFSSSGLLRERFEKGEAGDVFASADMGNPQKLQQEGLAGPVVLFTRNRLCAIVRPGLAVTTGDLLTTMLDPTVKLGTSTPNADPSGDYAWEVFRKADAVEPGSRARLETKALKLTGGANSAQPPAGLSPYAWHLKEGPADLFLAYCTGAREVEAQLPGTTTVPLPPALATGADYGLTVLKGADAGKASLLAMFILSADGQQILAKYGFETP
ncbi:MAG TPA: molybdate ABC transporter substrate-binding protein [Stellaceae bacterium]|jgi:ABC-type molybdate transport system substrate-binding protein|nr:molybdate ABC transporter substrate-binding protein [Stellaceae bacterium]